ncbi:hypothetical protein G6F16_013692 [Rhizopus arrhizus]|nr:hypothetical protein G6F16_013692 [Rhizopus arrhizus]KAG1145276.1 hypothetical protein G6F36_015169 [Rhizopus arrhizus]KAG1185327.1 hypothetical protein G6F35_014892 [Rhizopus arrhizus]
MELINSPEQAADAVLKETEDYTSSLNELSINEDNRANSSSSEDNLLEMKNAKRMAYDLLERVRVELTRTVVGIIVRMFCNFIRFAMYLCSQIR